MNVNQGTTRTSTQIAPAKVNLNLFVGPAREPGQPKAGYHPVDSVMACVGLVDEVRVTPHVGASSIGIGTPPLSIRWADDAPRPSPIDWPMEKDLAVKAIDRLAQHVGRPLPRSLEIVKRIPVGGGLGGGSSDAAAALVAADRAFDLQLPTSELLSIAAEIGSDVAFFVLCARQGIARARVSGLGEHVAPQESSPTPGRVVLILPPFGCATAQVYREFDRGDLGRQRDLFAQRSPSRLNMLAEAATRVEPRLNDLLSALRAGVPDAECWITGSGSTICAEVDRARGSDCSSIAAAITRASKSPKSAWMTDVVCVEVELLQHVNRT